MRQCLEQGCPNLAATGPRCGDHVRQREAKRGTRKERGYTAEYDRIRHALIRDYPWCGVCGVAEDLTVDHIVPLRLGGSHDLSNLRVVCRSCNSSKGSRV